MMTSSSPHRKVGLRWLLAVSVLVELLLLRTATRTLIHIPGIAGFESPVRAIAEVGRFAYYLAVVSLVATLVILGFQLVRSRNHVSLSAVPQPWLFSSLPPPGDSEVFPLRWSHGPVWRCW